MDIIEDIVYRIPSPAVLNIGDSISHGTGSYYSRKKKSEVEEDFLPYFDSEMDRLRKEDSVENPVN